MHLRRPSSERVVVRYSHPSPSSSSVLVLMPEDWSILVCDPPPSPPWMPVCDPPPSLPPNRAATVSGSDPKSTGRRPGDPAISTGVSLEGWRRYARYWPWPRGRHGRSRGRRGMSAIQIAQSISRISGPIRGWQRPWGRSPLMMEDVEQEGELGPPPELTEGAEAVNLQMSLVDFVELVEDTGESGEGKLGLHSELALLEKFGLFGSKDWDGRESEGQMLLESLKEHGFPCKPTLMDVPMATEVSRLAEGPVEEPVAGKADSEIALAKRAVEEPAASKKDGSIVTEEPIPADGIVEDPVAGKADTEIALAKGGEADGSIVTEEPRPTEETVQYPVAGKAVGEIAPKESRPEEGMLGKPMTGSEIALANRWLPLRYPAYPRTGKPEDIISHNTASKRIKRINKSGYDRIKNLPTLVKAFDRDSAASVKSLQEMDICMGAGISVVAISSVWPGHENHCSGVIISSNEDGEGTLKILTASGIVYNVDGNLHSPELKVSVQLSNDVKYDAQMLFVNKHYRIAILRVLKVRVDSSMDSLSFGSMPRYGQRVIALGRDSTDFFMRDGLISSLELTALGRTHYMFPESEHDFPLHCIGGPVIGEDGTMVGIITCHIPKAAMISIHIVQICIEMWKNYSRIARPQINMNLSTVQLLRAEHLYKMRCHYNKSSGFIVKGVEYDSAPEKLGIREGDVIEILDENCGPTLPELESYLLSHGLRLLSQMEGLTLTKELELKIRVHALVDEMVVDTTLAIPVADEVAMP